MARGFRALGGFGRRAAEGVWWWLRQVSGDAGYENYLRSATWRTVIRPEAPLSEQEFYLDQLRRRYSRLTRCC